MQRICIVISLLSCMVLLGGVCRGEDYELNYPNGLKPMRIPADNPLTVEKVELGKWLFFDKRLSSDNSVSCASCHDPKKGWSAHLYLVAHFRKWLFNKDPSITICHVGRPVQFDFFWFYLRPKWNNRRGRVSCGQIVKNYPSISFHPFPKGLEN